MTVWPSSSSCISVCDDGHFHGVIRRGWRIAVAAVRPVTGSPPAAGPGTPGCRAVAAAAARTTARSRAAAPHTACPAQGNTFATARCADISWRLRAGAR